MKPAARDQKRLYADLAWLWPLISPPEDYVSEAGEFVQAIRQHARIEVKTLLDLGCGGGHNDHTLRQHFQVTGVDLSEEMLGLARRLNPDVAYQVGDMRSLRLGQVFDAVLIADSIDYMLTEADLRAAFATAYAHLRPGGVFVTYAEETREHFEQNGTYLHTHSQSDLEVVMLENYYDPDPADSTYEMTFVYLIRQAGRLRIETDQHVGGIFSLPTWSRLLQEVGFEVKVLDFEEGGCPMFVGLRPIN
ncbi:MAG: class I SAM-dependent methyltransferase [Chloroflexota bacterium]